MIIKTSSSKMLDAFIEQTYTPHGGIDAFESKREATFNLANDIQDKWVKEAVDILNRPQDFVHHMEIPTTIEEGSLDQTTVAHDNLKGYDHSLEHDRLPALREKYDYIEPEHVECLEDVQMDTKSYEEVDLTDAPNLSGLFDNVFGI